MNETLKNYTENLIYYLKVDFAPPEKFSKESFHLNFENKRYRQKDLVRLIRDTVPYFALTPKEYETFVLNENTIEMGRIAWSRISKARKDKKGDYGELLLYLILSIFYDAEKFVTKVRLRTSVGMQIHGYDCAHFTIEGSEPILWLGEAKFYQSFSNALRKAINSVEDHCGNEFLRDEISILNQNIEINKGKAYDKLKQVLQGKSIDDIKIRIPILLTYDSSVIQNHQAISNYFKAKLSEELEKHYKTIESKEIENRKSNIEFLFILFPFNSVKEIKEQLEIIEDVSR